MKRLIAVMISIAVLFWVVPVVLAQTPEDVVNIMNAKTVDWSKFWQGLEFTKLADGRWEFAHEGRSLHDYTVVEVPANTLSVRHLYVVTSNTDYILYIVILNPKVVLHIRGEVGMSSRDASIRTVFVCKLATGLMCQQVLDALLRQGAQMQSLGVANRGYEHGALPEQPVFSFLLNSSGKFNR
ncbi:MAG: hypothetical protein Q7S49_00895 [bacterium]|nr:hypothetical protein [bacterium]